MLELSYRVRLVYTQLNCEQNKLVLSQLRLIYVLLGNILHTSHIEMLLISMCLSETAKFNPIHTRFRINPIHSTNPGFSCRNLFPFRSSLPSYQTKLIGSVCC